MQNCILMSFQPGYGLPVSALASQDGLRQDETLTDVIPDRAQLDWVSGIHIAGRRSKKTGCKEWIPTGVYTQLD